MKVLKKVLGAGNCVMVVPSPLLSPLSLLRHAIMKLRTLGESKPSSKVKVIYAFLLTSLPPCVSVCLPA